MNPDFPGNAPQNVNSNARILSLDVGTSSTRAIFFDVRGNKIGDAAQIEYSQSTTSDGGVETDADELLAHTFQAIDQLLNAAKSRNSNAKKTNSGNVKTQNSDAKISNTPDEIEQNSSATQFADAENVKAKGENSNSRNVFSENANVGKLTSQFADAGNSGAESDFDAPILAVSCSCFWHSLMAIDGEGRALTPLFSWADNRAAPWIPALRATLDEDDAHARTGCVFHTSYWPAKLLWLRHTRPELFVSSTRWIGFGEYLALKLCGSARASLSMASGTGIFDQNACDWDEETLNALPIARENLSPLCDAADENDDLRPAFATRWPLLKGAKWFPALGDGACSNVGSGCTTPARVAINVGTSGAMRVVLRHYSKAAPRGLWRYRIDRKRVLLGGAVSNGGVVFAWARKTLNLPDDAETKIAALAPDSHGLTVLPFLAGERSPLWDANARFTLEGASLDTTPIEVLQAALEASALRFAAVSKLLFSAVEDELTHISSTRNANSVAQIAPLNSISTSRNAEIPSQNSVLLAENETSQTSAKNSDFAAPNSTSNSAEMPESSTQTLNLFAQTSQMEKSLEETSNLGATIAANDVTKSNAHDEQLTFPIANSTDGNENSDSTKLINDEENSISRNENLNSVNANSVTKNADVTFDSATTHKENAHPTTNDLPKESSLQIVASGGALAKSPVWTRIMTNCLGAPLILSHEAEASARGAALMALEALEIIGDVDEIAAELGETFAPDAAIHEIYARALTRQNALYAKIYGAPSH